jgi:CRP/FNR family transcriptional regulator
MVTVDSLRACPLFSELEEEALRKIIPLCREEQYPKGAVIFTEGEEAHTLYLLQKGEVRLHYEICPQPDACQNTKIPVETAGAVIGWSALVKPRRLTASAHCLSDVELVAIDGGALNNLLEEDSHIGFVVVKALAEVINDRLRQAKELSFDRVMGML